MLPRRPDVGLFIDWTLEFDYTERQTVYKQHDVGTPGVVTFGDSHLVDREEIVGSGPVVVNDSDLCPTEHVTNRLILDGHTPDEHTVEVSVTGLER